MSLWTGAVSTDWGNPLNWTVGGTGTGVPSATVDAVFSGTPVRACVLGANRACRALTFTGYTSTVDFATFQLTTSNNITFQADQTSRILGTTGRLVVGGTCTITSNTGIWNLDIQFQNIGFTFALPDDMRIIGSYIGSGGGTQTFTGVGNLYIGGNVTMTGTRSSSGNLIMNGSGTYTGTAASDLEINTTGTVVVTGTVQFTRRFIITAVGTITMTAANITFQNSTTVDLGGRQVGTINHSFSLSSQTITYSTDLYCTSFAFGNGANTYNGPGKVYCSGNFALNAGTGSGNLVIELNGTGSISTGSTGIAVIINTVGTITLGATLTINNTFTYTAGTVNTVTSTVTINNGVTISSNPINWYNISIAASATVTFSSLFTVTNTLTLLGSATFIGAFGWITNNFTHGGAATTCTLKAGNTYVVNGIFTMIGTAASRALLVSNDSVVVTASIASLSNQLVVTVGTPTPPAAGYVLGSTSTALPAALNNLLPDRPTIASGAASPYTLVNAIGVTALASGSYTLGKKAFFIVTNGTGSTNVAYVTVRDIDSNGGITINAFGSYTDAIGQPSANIFRTLNWGPLIAPSGSVYYTFVN